MRDLTVTLSWDDGHPCDRRLAEHVARHGLAATFFVPIRNSEGRPTLGPADLRALAADGFEVAAHTRDHRRLQQLPAALARTQILDGRRQLEDILGQPVTGFAYPGGHPGRHGRRLAAEAGFSYARTTRLFCLQPGRDPLMMATTAQFYPHGPGALLRNWARGGGGAHRLRLAAGWMRAGGLPAALDRLAGAAAAAGATFHLWGHSWEIDEHGWWAQLDATLGALARLARPERRLTVAALAGRGSADTVSARPAPAHTAPAAGAAPDPG